MIGPLFKQWFIGPAEAITRKELRSMSQPEQKCGCAIGWAKDDPKGYTNAIVYCPLHQAAPRLLEALKVARQVMYGEGYRKEQNALMKQVEDAIQEAEGKS